MSIKVRRAAKELLVAALHCISVIPTYAIRSFPAHSHSVKLPCDMRDANRPVPERQRHECSRAVALPHQIVQKLRIGGAVHKVTAAAHAAGLVDGLFEAVVRLSTSPFSCASAGVLVVGNAAANEKFLLSSA